MKAAAGRGSVAGVGKMIGICASLSIQKTNADGRNQNVSRRDAETQRRKEMFLFFMTATQE
jgi:hypothetical protein